MGKTGHFPFIEILRNTVAPVFGVAGTHVMRLLREISRAGLRHRYIPATTELSAGFMATGYSRSTARLSFCLVTPGPGFLIGAAAMLEAKMKGTPVVFLSGQVHSDERGRGAKALHEFPGQPLVASLMTGDTFFPASPDEVNRSVARAVKNSLSVPLKPSYVELALETLLRYEGPGDRLDLDPVIPPSPRPDLLQKCASLIEDSEKPVILAGYGALFPGCGGDLLSMAEKLKAPLVTTITAKGAIPETSFFSGGVYRNDTARHIMGQGDLLIALGSSFSLLSTGNRKGPFPRKIINVNVDPSVPDLPGTEILHLACSVADFLQKIEFKEKKRKNGLLKITSDARRQQGDFARKQYPKEMAYTDVLEKALPEEAMIFTDPTIMAYWMRYFFKSKVPGTYHYPSGSNSLGFAFPAAVGGLIGIPEGKGFVITGDGNFPYFAGELKTAHEKKLDLTILLFNDSGYGVLREWSKWGVVERIGVNLENPDFRKVCHAHGMEYNRADCPEDLLGILEKTKRGGTSMIEIRDKLLPPWKVL